MKLQKKFAPITILLETEEDYNWLVATLRQAAESDNKMFRGPGKLQQEIMHFLRKLENAPLGGSL